MPLASYVRPRATSTRGKTPLTRQSVKRPRKTGIQLKPGQIRSVTVVHHRGPAGQTRIGWFFAAESGWDGEPVNREPAKHAELVWINPATPPYNLVAYTWAGLRAWQAQTPHAIHFQRPDSPIHYDPRHEDELTLLA